MSQRTRGLIIVYTGNGKGKTTAALGTALRAVGQNLKVSMIQFIKGKWRTGEVLASKELISKLEIIPMGAGFTWIPKEKGLDERLAREAWELSKKKILSAEWDLIILDEITYPINYKFIDLRDVLDTLKKKPERLHIILTGRNAPQELVDLADLVSEVREVKHPFKAGIRAQRGIDF